MKWILVSIIMLLPFIGLTQNSVSNKSTDSCYLYIPNVFSVECTYPAKDYTFQIYSNCVMLEFELTIYNRWADELFTTNDIHATWYAGDQEEEFFVYELCAESQCGQFFDSRGNFMILK